MSHIRKTVLGLKGLYFAAAGSTIANADWEQLAVNLEGTFNLAQDDNEETEIYIEESDTPIVQLIKAGKRSFTTSIPDLAFEVVQNLFGATKETVVVEGVSITRVKIPDQAQYIYKMFKIVPSEGVEQFYFTKGQVSAKINGPLSKTETLNIDLVVTALTPDTSENAFIYDLASGANPGYLLGDTAAATALTVLQAVSAGGMSLTVDGGAAQDVGNIDFSTIDTSDIEEGWNDVVVLLNAAFTGATFSFDIDEFRLKITSDTTGSGSTIAQASPGSGTDIRIATMLNISSSTPVAGS